jgi:hypothetical protein
MGFRKATLSILYGSALMLLCVRPVAGQAVEASSTRADIARSQTETSPGGTQFNAGAATANDADLGQQEVIAEQQQKYQPFTVAVAAPIYWTSNAFLTRSDEASDVITAPGAAIYYQPRITGALFGLLDVRNQQFYYNRFDQLNFGDFAVDAGLNMTLPQMENLTLRAQYTYDRLTKKDSFSAFFQNHEIILNAEVPVRIGQAQLLAFGAATTLSFVSEPEVSRRNDYEAYVAYNIAITRAISVAASGRMTVRDYYHENSRVDLSELAALSATCAVSRYMSISALSTFGANQSNQSIFDYKVGNVGGSVVVGIKF